eukprot:scaffold519_cov331-Pavlova_lutheri.AAC.4
MEAQTVPSSRVPEAQNANWKNGMDWDRMDKRKFFGYGAGLFGTVALGLFPLSVLKTRMMVSQERYGLRDTATLARTICREEGIQGLYKGMGTIVAGKIPARFIYLGALEAFKSVAAKGVGDGWLSDAAAAGAINFGAGGASSLLTQCVFVPVEVISQRQMINKSVNNRPNGWRVAQAIWKSEGPRGLYRGFGASVATFVPNSAIWWGSYGAYQQLVWKHIFPEEHLIRNEGGVTKDEQRQGSSLVKVQAMSGILAGCTAAFCTNPLDVIKTRLQVSPLDERGKKPLATKVLADVLRDSGVRGLYKGVVPRMMSVSLWGTCMVSVYELIKRMSTLPEPASH